MLPLPLHPVVLLGLLALSSVTRVALEVEASPLFQIFQQASKMGWLKVRLLCASRGAQVQEALNQGGKEFLLVKVMLFEV
jgi:hypothetical protein